MKKLLMIVCFMLPARAWATEDLTLTSPLTRPSTSVWRLDEFSFSVSSHNVTLTFRDPTNNTSITCTESGAAADAVISALNTANLTNNSLVKRSTNRAITSGCLGAGTISGTPQ